MVNKNLFGNGTRGKTPRPVTTDAEGKPTRNEAGGVAFKFTPKHALAQYACTGTLNNTYYATDRDQFKKTLELVQQVDAPEFLGKLAVYSRKHAFMKDMPALLVAVLFARSSPKSPAAVPGTSPSGELSARAQGVRAMADAAIALQYRTVFKQVFPIVIDNGKMLRNFVQIITSGALGRKSFGRVGLKALQGWFEARSPYAIFRASVGNDPTMADIIKLAHPKAETVEKDALYAYLIGAPTKEQLEASPAEGDKARLARGAYLDVEKLPEIVKQFEAFKKDTSLPAPNVDFRQLTALDLDTAKWREIAMNGRWHQTRMNLNTYARHGVFEGIKGAEIAQALAKRLADPEQIEKAMVFPYQLFAAYMAAQDIPMVLKLALQDAMEHATKNVPALPGHTWVFPDVSGSMSAPITGYRRGGTTSMTCIDVAALVSAAILRTSPHATVLPVDTRLHTGYKPNPRDSVVTNAETLRRFGGGGTKLDVALKHLAETGAPVDTIIFVSDNMSWKAPSYRYGYVGTAQTSASEAYWQAIRAKNPNAKLVSMMVAAYDSTQVADDKEHLSVLNIGGFSDQVFEVISRFVQGDRASFWVEEIEKVTLG